MEITPKMNIECIRLFGSFSRGDEAKNSDYDVLVVLKKQQIVTEDLKCYVESLFDREISISWYSWDRIAMLYKLGHLFAWHLYLESKVLFGESDYISSLGKPKEYTFSYVDVNSLIGILQPLKDAVTEVPKNLIYESGLLYVCARNIGISASPVLMKKFNFSVYAPYDLGLNVSLTEYDKLVSCRYCSTRGLNPPGIVVEEFMALYNEIYKWANHCLDSIENIAK